MSERRKEEEGVDVMKTYGRGGGKCSEHRRKRVDGMKTEGRGGSGCDEDRRKKVKWL